MDVVTLISVIATFVVGATTLILTQWQHHRDTRHGDIRWAVEMALSGDPTTRASGLAILEKFAPAEKLSRRESFIVSTILQVVPALTEEEQ